MPDLPRLRRTQSGHNDALCRTQLPGSVGDGHTPAGVPMLQMGTRLAPFAIAGGHQVITMDAAFR